MFSLSPSKSFNSPGLLVVGIQYKRFRISWKRITYLQGRRRRLHTFMTLQIVNSRISIYEVEVDVGNLASRTTRDLPSFIERLLQLIPSLMSHRCIAGEDGGFVKEMRKGTDFAHVLEHVLLELEHLADRTRRVYRGWTRRRTESDLASSIYIIHYEAKDFLTGRLAAALGVQLIKDLLAGQIVDIVRIIRQLEDPMSYLKEEGKTPLRRNIPHIEILWESAKIDYLEVDPARQDFGAIDLPISRENILSGFSEGEKEATALALQHLRPHLADVQKHWLDKVSEFGGKCTDAIHGPIEALGITPPIFVFEDGRQDKYDQMVTDAGRNLATAQVPFSLLLYAVNLYEKCMVAKLLQVVPDKEQLQNSWMALQGLFHHHLLIISLAYFDQLHLMRSPSKRPPIHLI